MNFDSSAFDLMKELKGIRKERGMIIDSTAVQESIAIKALGWIPFKSGAAKWVNGQVRCAGYYFSKTV